MSGIGTFIIIWLYSSLAQYILFKVLKYKEKDYWLHGIAYLCLLMGILGGVFMVGVIREHDSYGQALYKAFIVNIYAIGFILSYYLIIYYRLNYAIRPVLFTIPTWISAIIFEYNVAYLVIYVPLSVIIGLIIPWMYETVDDNR